MHTRVKVNMFVVPREHVKDGGNTKMMKTLLEWLELWCIGKLMIPYLLLKRMDTNC